MRRFAVAARREADPTARYVAATPPASAPWNVSAPLVMPSPYSPAWFVHPDVVHVPGGLHGFEYWMAVTPYPNGDADKENPSILVSPTPTDWRVPPRGQNPIATGFNSDTDLALDPDGRTLHLIWRETSNDAIKHKSSVDGFTWSATTSLLTVDARGDNTEALSPAVVHDGTQWVMFTVDFVDKVIHRRTAAAITGPWSSPQAVTYTLPSAGVSGEVWEPWHVNVFRHGGVYRMILNEAKSGSPAEKGIRLNSSADGVTWTAGATQIIAATAGWDAQPYRATGVIRPSDGALHLWYSAFSGTHGWNVGYTVIPAGVTGWFPSP